MSLQRWREREKTSLGICKECDNAYQMSMPNMCLTCHPPPHTTTAPSYPTTTPLWGVLHWVLCSCQQQNVLYASFRFMTINTIILHLPLPLPLTHSLQLFHSLPVYGHVFRGGGSKGAGQQLHMELLLSLSFSLSTHRIWRNKVTSAAAMRRRCQRHCHLFACLCV